MRGSGRIGSKPAFRSWSFVGISPACFNRMSSTFRILNMLAPYDPGVTVELDRRCHESLHTYQESLERCRSSSVYCRDVASPLRRLPIDDDIAKNASRVPALVAA